MLGLILVLVAVLSGLFALFRSHVPFELPLTAPDAAAAAGFLLVAGVVAVLGGRA
jgi:hypothetical protein